MFYFYLLFPKTLSRSSDHYDKMNVDHIMIFRKLYVSDESVHRVSAFL